MPVKNYDGDVIRRSLSCIMECTGLYFITLIQWDPKLRSGVRDYIYIWNLAMTHVKSVENFDQVFDKSENPQDSYLVINIGTGNDVTVKELFSIFEGFLGRPVSKVETEALN